MKCLERNKQVIFYASYIGRVEIIDEYGNSTGQYRNTYSAPTALKANVSPARGQSSTREFGDTVDYDKVIVLDDPTDPINENSILWIDNLDTAQEHDYIVKQVGISLNNTSIAVKRVSVSA